MYRIYLLLFGVMTCMISSAQSKTYPIINEERNVSGIFKHDTIASQYLDLFIIGDGFIDEADRRPDRLGNPAALLIIPSMLENGVSFHGNIVGDVQYRGNSYYVYLSDGTHLLQIVTPSRTISIDLAELNDKVESLEGGRQYYLCGLDNDFSNKTNRIELYKGSRVSSKIRDFARSFINYSKSGDIKSLQQLSESGISKNWEDYISLVSQNMKKDGNGVTPNLISAMFHGAKQGVFGLTFEINKSINNDGSVEYVVVMLIDNDNEDLIQYVITYQTKDDYCKNGIYTLDDFFIP